MRISALGVFGALIEHTVFGTLWLLWKGGTWLGLNNNGWAFGPGTPMVMPDEFAPVVPIPPPEAPPEAAAEPEAPPAGLVGHRNSKTLHLPTCRYAPPPELARPFSQRSSAEEAGFRPCKLCFSD